MIVHECDARDRVDTLLRRQMMQTGGQVAEVSVSQGLVCGYTFAGTWLEHCRGKVLGKGDVKQTWPDVTQLQDWFVIAQLVRTIVGEAGHSRPAVLCRGPHHAEYLVQLVVDITHPREAGVAIEHFYEDTTSTPHVETGRVICASQQHVRRSVPKIVFKVKCQKIFSAAKLFLFNRTKH